MFLTSANLKSFYNSFLYEKRTVNPGIEPPFSNPQLSTQPTEPLSHVQEASFKLSQYLRFLNLNIITVRSRSNPDPIIYEFPHGIKPWTFEVLPTFSRPLAFETRRQFTTPISMRKEPSALGLNPWLPTYSSAPYPLSHQAMWKKASSHLVMFLDSWT